MEALQQQQRLRDDQMGKKGASSSATLNLRNSPNSQHPKYAVMIRDAIVSTKQRKGASTLSIAKAIQSKHKGQLPDNFRKMLTLQLRKLVRSGRIVKDQSKFRCTPWFKKNPQASLVKQTEEPQPSRRRRPRTRAPSSQKKRTRSCGQKKPRNAKRQRRSQPTRKISLVKKSNKKKPKTRKTKRSSRSRSRARAMSRSKSRSKSRRPALGRKRNKAAKKKPAAKRHRNIRKRGRY